MPRRNDLTAARPGAQGRAEARSRRCAPLRRRSRRPPAIPHGRPRSTRVRNALFDARPVRHPRSRACRRPHVSPALIDRLLAQAGRVAAVAQRLARAARCARRPSPIRCRPASPSGPRDRPAARASLRQSYIDAARSRCSGAAFVIVPLFQLHAGAGERARSRRSPTPGHATRSRSRNGCTRSRACGRGARPDWAMAATRWIERRDRRSRGRAVAASRGRAMDRRHVRRRATARRVAVAAGARRAPTARRRCSAVWSSTTGPRPCRPLGDDRRRVQLQSAERRRAAGGARRRAAGAARPLGVGRSRRLGARSARSRQAARGRARPADRPRQRRRRTATTSRCCRRSSSEFTARPLVATGTSPAQAAVARAIKDVIAPCPSTFAPPPSTTSRSRRASRSRSCAAGTGSRDVRAAPISSAACAPRCAIRCGSSRDNGSTASSRARTPGSPIDARIAYDDRAARRLSPSARRRIAVRLRDAARGAVEREAVPFDLMLHMQAARVFERLLARRAAAPARLRTTSDCSPLDYATRRRRRRHAPTRAHCSRPARPSCSTRRS